MKKITALLLSVLMIVGALSGCLNNEQVETTPTIETQPQPTRPTVLNWEFSKMALPQINWGEEGPDSLSTCLGDFDYLDEKIQNSDLLKNTFTSIDVEDKTIINAKTDPTTDNKGNDDQATESTEGTEAVDNQEHVETTEPTKESEETLLYRSKTYVCTNDEMRLEITIMEDAEYFENVSGAEIAIYLLSDSSFTTEHQSLITDITKLVYGEHIGEYVALAKDNDGKYNNGNDIKPENILTGIMSDNDQVTMNYNVTLARTTNTPSAREQMFISVLFTCANG